MTAHPQPSCSVYIPASDGVRLAADIWLPAASDSVPAIVVFTRYWRSYAAAGSAIAPNLRPIVRHFNASGYAVLIIDVRGTGASYGSRETEWSPAETGDFGPVFEWISQQRWSNGRIATMGTSYCGNTAELAVLAKHRALKAIVPRFSDFTEYQHAFFPGGVRNLVIADRWVEFVSALDANDPQAAFSSRGSESNADWRNGVRTVAGDVEALRAAVRDHQRNTDLRSVMASLRFADDPFGPRSKPEMTLESISPSGCVPEIVAANVPSMHWASWLDGGTADGALTRFVNFPGSMHVVIGAWNHGGGEDADPFARHAGGAPSPSVEAQHGAIQRFLDPLLLEDHAQPAKRVIEYLTLGSNEWRSSECWPPEGSALEPFFLQAGGQLTDVRADKEGQRAYQVDFDTSTGPCNRWTTQLGATVDYGDRQEADRWLLTFTSQPLHQSMELTGSPVLHAVLKTSGSDGALFAYLEVVAPGGRVTYLTDGVVRLIFHGADGAATPYRQLGKMPGFTRHEAHPIVPGEWITARLSLNPLSVQVPAGHRIRLALAGADKGTFETLPAQGPAPQLVFLCGGASGSFIELPVVRASRRSL